MSKGLKTLQSFTHLTSNGITKFSVCIITLPNQSGRLSMYVYIHPLNVTNYLMNAQIQSESSSYSRCHGCSANTDLTTDESADGGRFVLLVTLDWGGETSGGSIVSGWGNDLLITSGVNSRRDVLLVTGRGTGGRGNDILLVTSGVTSGVINLDISGSRGIIGGRGSSRGSWSDRGDRCAFSGSGGCD
jgi:hypothetical protein